MYDFHYVTKREAREARDEFEEIIHKAQDLLRDKFTFRYWFIGSSSRNMITYDYKSNVGYDFDINVEINDEENTFSAKKLRSDLRQALDRAASPLGYKYCEDSTRVLTLKKVDTKNARIMRSCDIAIINIHSAGQEYIHYNKKQKVYSWKDQPIPDDELEQKAEWLRKNGYWQDVRKYYIQKKNKNENPNKRSRSLYAEAVSDVFNWYNCR